ncbi:hypothetical protein [Rhizobium lentis]|uniref:hypothetical protein n=1 Tax=Rhizobium lentis TaxID=1138194 RepID=UPI0016165F31|nr:hypothetical protein [Rhizobium lentis]MBB4576538.1 hypothetical protein [Rhizobium lentis]MBB5552597.1 hypothetical protein [Rhizobium lentis]MBB5569414.1 hypothetical protein [Rhizobium lentis]
MKVTLFNAGTMPALLNRLIGDHDEIQIAVAWGYNGKLADRLMENKVLHLQCFKGRTSRLQSLETVLKRSFLLISSRVIAGVEELPRVCVDRRGRGPGYHRERPSAHRRRWRDARSVDFARA